MAGNYTHMINSVGAQSIIYVSHNQTSHINADSKNTYRVDGSALFGVTKIQERCQAVTTVSTCSSGQYFCLSENTCKPAGQACSVTTCNNNTCEIGESCNCGDCTNGGADDQDRCGGGASGQLVCTRDRDNSTTP